jgi:hypothetical protein
LVGDKTLPIVPLVCAFYVSLLSFYLYILFFASFFYSFTADFFVTCQRTHITIIITANTTTTSYSFLAYKGEYALSGKFIRLFVCLFVCSPLWLAVNGRTAATAAMFITFIHNI